MRREYNDRRTQMFRSSRGLPPGRPYTEPPSRIPRDIVQFHDTLDEDHELRYATTSKWVKAYNAFALVHQELQREAQRKSTVATHEILEMIREQLAPGQKVVVFIGGFEYLDGAFEDVSVGKPGNQAFVNPGTKVFTITSNRPGPALPGSETTTFAVPTTTGIKFVNVGSDHSDSSASDRPWRGDMRDYYDRWNKDPGTIDLDFAEKDFKDTVA